MSRYFGDNDALARKRMRVPSHTDMREKRADKMIEQGPRLEVLSGRVFLIIPQPRYSKKVWDFWQQTGGEWVENEFYPFFRFDLTGKKNQREWLDRATAKFNEFWKGKVDE